jgi:DNA-binding transcriptional ArsR family regulator
MSVASAPAPVFAALGDPTRLGLLSSLSRHGPQSIAALAAGTRMTRQAVTKHLKVLERVGLVRNERFGRETRFTCEPGPLGAARDYLDAVAAQWDAALGRLQAMVEAPN